jgi:hypothetical protein
MFVKNFFNWLSQLMRVRILRYSKTYSTCTQWEKMHLEIYRQKMENVSFFYVFFANFRRMIHITLSDYGYRNFIFFLLSN